MKNDNLKLRH